MKVVTIGGGGGTKAIIEAIMKMKLRSNSSNLTLSCVMTTLDSGGSSGALRSQTGFCVGDLRVAIAALAHPIIERMFNARTKPSGEKSHFDGHAVGNLLIGSFLESFENPQQALDALHEAFNLNGTVIPVTFMAGDVYAKLRDGTTLEGEGVIYESNVIEHGGVERFWIDPQLAPNPMAIRAIAEADYIIFCPGTLLCSILPPILIPGIKEALLETSAKKICVTNIVNRDGHMPPHATVMEHVSMIEESLCNGFFNYVIYNTAPLLPELAKLFVLEGKTPHFNTDGGRALNRSMIGHPLLDEDAMKLRVEQFKNRRDSKDALLSLRSPVSHSSEALSVPLGWILK